MGSAPFPLEAQILIAERAGEGDLADMRLADSAGGSASKRRKPALDLAALVIEPALVVRFRRAIAPFVDLQQRGIHDAVGERLHRQGGNALSARSG